MKILSIETSCDETGISIIDGSGETVTLLGNALASQIDIHAQYGGVFPALAKRAHTEKFVPLLTEALTAAKMLVLGPSRPKLDEVAILCEKDPILNETLTAFLSTYEKPNIDYIAVTTGPGLEPALWVGITAAKALSTTWNIPLIPINHMEGHILVALLEEVESGTLKVESNSQITSGKKQTTYSLIPLQFPALALLVSGGHTELVLVHDYARYEKIGQTVDDAIGEAFDKVARILGLPYPGGPAISKLAAQFRALGIKNEIEMPRPMIHSGDYKFSFSGLKTAMLYKAREVTDNNARELTDGEKLALAAAFEDAAVEVVVKKTAKAVDEFGIQTLIVGGGVAANTYLREQLSLYLGAGLLSTILFPETWLSTDNSVMIAIAAYVRALHGHTESEAMADMKADGNLSITDGGYRK